MVEEGGMSIAVSKFTFYKSKLVLWFSEMSFGKPVHDLSLKKFYLFSKKGVARTPPPPLVKTL